MQQILQMLKLQQELNDIQYLMEVNTVDIPISFASDLKDEDNIALKPRTKPKLNRKEIKEYMKLHNVSSIEAIKISSSSNKGYK